MRNHFLKEGLDVRLSHRTFSLRSALNKKASGPPVCKKKDCTLESRLCFRRNVVYQITCNKCFKKYIGSTIRDLHTRVAEHFNNVNSSVKKHMMSCNCTAVDTSVKILDHERRKGSLRIREAFFINKEKPEINSKEESCIDLILF